MKYRYYIILLLMLMPTMISFLTQGCRREITPLAPADRSDAPESVAPSAIHDFGDGCLKCHPEYGPRKTDTGPNLVMSYPDVKLADVTHAEILCTTCHDPHAGSTNLRLIYQQIWTPMNGLKNVLFTKYYGTNSFADGNTTYNGVCEVCHTLTLYHRNNSSGDHTHYAGARCTGCHAHWNQFQPVTGNCLTCHNTTQPNGTGDYRRAIVGSNGDFRRASHHVNNGLGSESVIAPDCLVCHQNSMHRSLTNPLRVRLYNRDDSKTITYSGTASTLEPFCLSCHDGDADVPFSDGRTPSNIESAWAGSSHKLTGLTCFGSGSSTGCHNNGHGSDKTALKAPYSGATPDEENFCFVCHDADGPGINIQAKFAGTLRATPGTGAKLNMHHDVSDADQTYSGAEIECKNCHNPHSATSSQPYISNVDPGDGRTPAPGNTFAGSKLTTEFCFECHDNSYPASVRPPTIALKDLRNLWINSGGGDISDQHGPAIASSTVSLRAGSGYARGEILNCDACHELGHGSSGNLFQLKTTIYSKDGTTPLVSDAGGTTVYVTDISSSNTNKLTNGQNWCSTCHPNPMGGNKNKDCLNCHYHGDRF